MPARGNCLIKVFFFFLIASAIFLFLPKVVLAQVVINEFSSSSDPEWVELYSSSVDQITDLSGWRIVDANASLTDDLVLSGCIAPQEFRLFRRSSGWLNNDGDTISLKNAADELVGESVTYGEGGVVTTPSSEKSAGRDPDGETSWKIFDSPTPANDDCQMESTLAPTFSPTPTPTTAPSLTTATYKINEVKNENGDVLSSVKVYVDNMYLHHYAPETLTFCDGCQCDTYVDCGFGEHTVKLEKDDYQDWNETKTINSGNAYEVNPVMEAADSATSAPTPTPTKTPTPTSIVASTPTPKPTGTTETPSPGEVLGEKEFYPLEAAEEGKESEETISAGGKRKVLPFVFLGFGFVFLFGAGFYFWYTRLRTTDSGVS